MSDANWGNCKSCRHFTSHNPRPGDSEVAQCAQPDLSEFSLSVSGLSGCSAHEDRPGLEESHGAFEDAGAALH
jgi:hypothetical protein